VLIYFQPVLQKKVISAFQFALNQDGYLFLGTSETVGDSDNFFLSCSTKWKTFQYKGGFRPTLEDSHLKRTNLSPQPSLNRRAIAPHEDWRTVDGIQRGVIEAFLPPTAVVDESLNLVYVAGDLDAYLKVSSGGVFTANILKQARPGLSIPLSTALHKVFKDQEEVTYRNIHLNGTDMNNLVDLRAKPFLEPVSRQKMALIQFTPIVQTSSERIDLKSFDINSSAQQRIQDLEHELQYTRESLQATVEELETSNEELQATNEELFAANEELQSTNEELHSVNEELITVNAEYHAKIQELTMLNEDVNNLLSSTDVGTLFLDRDLRIRLFTSVVQQDIHVMDQDIGRPIGHVTHTILDCDLVHEAQQVLKTLTSREMEVKNNRGRWYQMKLLPYYTLQKSVGGVVITLTDITELKMANIQLARLSVAVEQSPASILITDLDGIIEYVNLRFSQVTGYSAEEAIGQPSSILKTEMTPIETHRQMWDSINAGKVWRGEFVNKRKSGEYYLESAVISPIFGENGEIRQYLSVQMDLSLQKENEKALFDSREALRLNLEKYRLLFDSFPHGITIVDKNGQIMECNREAERLLGISKETRSHPEIQRQIVRSDGTPMPLEEYVSARMLRENRPVENMEMGIVKEDGEIIWMRVTAAPLSDFGALVIYTDTYRG
jgi:two-component system CheB/CheR fusion protein